MDAHRIQRHLARFAEDRDWEPFHTPKNLAMALAGEAGELVSEFRWLTPEESTRPTAEQMERIRHEIGDVAIFLLRLCDKLSIDLEMAIEDKIRVNEGNYPVALAKGTAEKHTQLKERS